MEWWFFEGAAKQRRKHGLLMILRHLLAGISEIRWQDSLKTPASLLLGHSSCLSCFVFSDNNKQPVVMLHQNVILLFCDQLNCKMWWRQADGMLFTIIIYIFLSRCLSWVFLICCVNVSVSHYTTSCCIAAKADNNVTGLLVLPNLTHTGLFIGWLSSERLGFWRILCDEEHEMLSVTADLLNLESSGNRTLFHLMRNGCSFTVIWLPVSQSFSLCLDGGRPWWGNVVNNLFFFTPNSDQKVCCWSSTNMF